MLKLSIYIFIFLNIYGGFFIEINGQEITLTLQAEKPFSQGLKDTLKLQKSYSNLEILKQKVDTINLTLQRMGYLDSEMNQLIKENDSSYLADIYLGKKYNSIKIKFSEKDFTKKELQRVSAKIEENHFIIPFEKIPVSMRILTAIQNQKGNAFARLKLSEIEKSNEDALIATLFLETGNVRTVDSIAIRGYEKFPKSFLKYYAGIRKGEVFNKNKLVEKSEILNSLGFVSASKIPEALFRKDSTIVYFYLEKENDNQFDGIVGFATNEETQKLELNGYLNLELNNNLNYGEQFLLNYKADGKEQIQFRVKAVLPYLFQTPIGVSGELNIFKRDSSFVTTEQQLRTTYQINPSSQIYIGFRGYDSSNLMDETIAGIPIEDFKSKFITAGGLFMKHQNRKLFPIKTLLSLDLGLGSRKQKKINEHQYKVEFRANNIFRLNPKNSIYAQSATHFLISDNFLVNELYRFGGINSIRGFDENSIDASLYSVINTEYRYQFNETVFVHSIIDLGYFENQTIELKQKLYSFGLGLGLTTKAGLFRFIVANGNTEGQIFEFGSTKIHLSVSSKF